MTAADSLRGHRSSAGPRPRHVELAHDPVQFFLIQSFPREDLRHRRVGELLLETQLAPSLKVVVLHLEMRQRRLSGIR